MAYLVTWEPRGVYKRFIKEIVGNEFMRSALMVQGGYRFDSVRYVINDFSEIKSHNITYSNIVSFTGFARGAFSTNPNIKVAIVSADQEIIDLFNLAKESPLSMPYPLEIFTTAEDARAWVEA